MRKPILLVVDDDAYASAALAAKLAVLGEVRVAGSGSEALRVAREQVPDAAVMDAEMPGMTGFDLCQAFKQDGRLQQVPVIIASAFHDASTEAAARALGAADFVRKPYAGEALVERVRALLNAAGRMQSTAAAVVAGGAPSILIVDDDTASIQVLYAALKNLDARFTFATNGEQALRLALERRPDLVLLDIQMPGMDGIEVCRRLQAEADFAHVPVIFVTRYSDPEHEARALAAGGTDFISKPYSPAVLQARIGTVLRLKRQSDQQLRAEREHWRRLSEERVSEIVEQASDAIISVDRRGEIVLFNAAAAELFGLSAEDALGLQLNALLPAAWPTPQNNAQDFLLVDLLRRDGRRLFAQMSCTHSGEGEAGISTIWLRDRTEHLQLEQALQAKLKAEAENQAKCAFLAAMSHEIRTPLNAIIGLTHLLPRGGLSAEQQILADQIDDSGRNVLGIVNDVLDLARIEANCLEMHMEDFPTALLFNEVRSALRALAEANQIEIITDYASAPEVLHGDRRRLAQALLNLTANAVKFAEPGPVSLAARLLAQEDGQVLLRFEVADSGRSVAPADMARLAEAFAQGNPELAQSHGGRGLSLVISRRLAVLMGGSAGADCVPGQGNRFWFDVRLAPGVAVQQDAAVTHAGAAEAELAQRRPRLLLVEDEPVNRVVALEVLGVLGLAVDCAENGVEAIARVEAGTYDAVLMDVRMPVMDGIEATRRIRALTGRETLPILGMSANAFAEDRQACLDAGMDDFLAKPAQPTEIYARLLALLDRVTQ
ncbi:MAG: response regulator [Rhodocyclaceae bacterium]|nr:response regulator [Rhodocyclaceae bacterium]MBX3668356.1 response regulator [Rhodocyclaceae bacterium]